MPPRKSAEDGQADFHSAFSPLSTPLSFVSDNVVCCVVGNSVCLWNIETGKKDFIYHSAYSISKLCGDPAKGLLAFCEGGTSPQVFVYNTEPPKLLYTLSDITDLELADLVFSHCGTRLYALSRATAKRLCVFSTQTGQKLKGCDLDLPLRFDKISVYPGHKDYIALIRSSTVRLLTIQKSYETYLTRLHPAAIPTDADLSISAYAWVQGGQFVIATRQGTLHTMDGGTGSLLHSCSVEMPITSITVNERHVITAHIGSVLNFWSHDPSALPASEQSVTLSNDMPSMEETGAFISRKRVELDTLQEAIAPELRMAGQVAYFQVLPGQSARAILATAEGEVWTMQLPHAPATDGEAEEEDSGAAIGDLDMKLLTWFHTHPVSDVAMLSSDGSLCASADEGGRLRIWTSLKGSDPKGFRTLSFTSALTSITVDAGGNFVIVASDLGCVHVVSTSNWKKANVVDTLRLSDAGVVKLCSVTYEGWCVSVAALLFNNKIAFFRVMLKDPKIHMFGLVDGVGNIEDIAFHTGDFKPDSTTPARLLVAGTTHETNWPALWLLRAPPLDHDPTHCELKRDTCPLWSVKLSTDGQKLEDKPSCVISTPKKTVVIGFANGAIRAYALPSNSGQPLSKSAASSVLETFGSHEQLITSLSVTQDGLWIISCSMDGVVRRASMDSGNRKGGVQRILHNPYNGGALQAQANSDGTVFLSTGGADGVLVWSGHGSGASPGPAPSPAPLEEDLEELVYAVDDKDTNLYPIWEPISNDDKGMAAKGEDADDPELNAVTVAQKKALMFEVEALRKKLRTLIDANATCPDLEKLERNEFCVDTEERDAIAATTKERCDVLRAEIERENVARQLIRDRLIKEFWDPMRTKGCQISSLMSNFSVSNYPERIISDKEISTTNKLRNMRKVDQMELQMLRSPQCPEGLRDDIVLKAEHFTTGKESYIVNWWEHDPASPQKSVPEGGHQDQALLYEPFELLTNSRRRLQIHLLQSLAAEYRAAFNELFKTCQQDKKSIVDQIREKISRIRSILGELQIEEDVPEPELHDSEDADSVLKVKDSEIKVEKWISEEEKKAIAEAKAKEEERLRKLRENDAGTRAIMQMMGGTLKTKKDLSALEITLDKEPWMDLIPEEEMTEVQLLALKEFRDKEKALAEEQDKYRKQLDAELKRLRSEVQELTQQFETILKGLANARFTHDAKFYCQELYCVRLQLALLQNVEDNEVLRQSNTDVDQSQSKLTDAEGKLNDFNDEVKSSRDVQDERVRFEREVASAQHFRQQFGQSGLEPEQVTALLQIFRRRARERPRHTNISPEAIDKKLSSGDFSTFSFNPSEARDPYPDLGTVIESASDQSLIEDTIDDDCPEGVDDASFKRMIELRRERLLAEHEVQKGSAVMTEMSSLLAHLQKERDDLKAEHDQLQMELTEHWQLMDRELYDIEILFKLKQGQVEVPQAAVVTDYSDAVVIGTEVVESRNRRIMELGKNKIGTLETIKEFRKKLNFLQWEHNTLAMQTTDLEERTKDVHMLRVTKGLQALLKGGEEGRNKADADLLERKIEHLNNTTLQKEQALKKQYGMSSQATKLRKMENSMLEKKLRELQQNVIQREHIRRLKAPGGGAGSTGGAKEGGKPRIIGGGGRIEENEGVIRSAQTTFREVRIRQGLMDAAKKHTEEIDLLRKELDRLRQKTFPSFVQLHEDRPSNPDMI
mmetsp:Transcript_15588/g.33086  ORF Transcript_15588/g.33086 Transcript_15588/m.33086 type:complete len:1700 (-) Transcript_15588:374-5473(-)